MNPRFERAGTRNFSKIYQSIQETPTGLIVAELQMKTNPLVDVSSDVRPNSSTVEDIHFGDGGKGKVTQEMIIYMRQALMEKKRVKDKKVHSHRINGSDNAGHEIRENGQEIALHQLPVAVTIEGAVGNMSKGMLVHPLNLVTEMDYVSDKLGGTLWGELRIDRNAIVYTSENGFRNLDLNHVHFRSNE